MIKKKWNTLKTLIAIFWNKILVLVTESLLRILPVKRNRIVFSSFLGKSFSCNPRAIYEYLLKNYGKQFQYVWMFDYDKDPEIPNELTENAKCVQIGSLKSKYYKATSGFWVFNHRNNDFFYKKKRQFFLQTWHGDIGLKGFDAQIYSASQYQNPYVKKCLKDSEMLDAIIVGSDWGEQNMRSAFFCPEKTYWKCGYPRTDILLHPDEQTDVILSVRNRYHLSPETKICLYAPTFRKGFSINELFYSDGSNKYEQILNALQTRFGGEWVIFMRVHPACLEQEKKENFDFGDHVIDASAYPDMRDLLVACDALISDYSSTPYEIALTGKPCWLYMDDFEEYKKYTKIVFDLNNLLFDKCYDIESLAEAIQTFNEKKYEQDMKKMLKILGSCEKGTACAFVADKFIQYLSRK